MVGKNYFRQQAEVLLELAKSLSDPKMAAAVLQKAADLQTQIDGVAPATDRSPVAPDVERPAASTRGST